MKENIRKYILYALGEILLVVFGILIALQVNNWNEERKQDLTEQQYLTRLKAEAEDNVSSMENSADEYQFNARLLKAVANNLENDVPLPDSMLKALDYGLSPTFIQTWSFNSTTYDEIVSTGGLRLIDDIELKEYLDEAFAANQFGIRQLEYWRNISVSDMAFFEQYRKTEYTTDEENYTINITLRIEAMKGNETAIEKLKFWGAANMLFYEGMRFQRAKFMDVVEKIECLQSENNCNNEKQN